MSQNTPPNAPGRDDQDSPSQDSGRDHIGSNPYYTHQQPQPPDLDAGAPALRSADMRRINRKALAFLAGIILLLLVMGYLVLQNASSDKDEVARQPREERVVVPELPQAAPADAAEPEPIELAQPAPPMPPPLPPAEPSMLPMPEASGPQGPTLLERRMMTEAAASGGQGQSGQPDVYTQALLNAVTNQGNADAQRAVPEARTSALFISKPDSLLVRGTYIRCVLETRIITDVPGFTSCIVTEPVYSINGRSLLLPKGSKILGSYNTAPSGPRVAVVWDRITTPNGIDVSMASPGVDNLGSAGHPGDYNAHWGSKITSALLISLLSDAFKYAGEKNGPTTTTTYGNGFVVEQPFESNTARAIERLADQALQQSAARPPTVTINQGTIVNVYVAKDVDFSGVVASL